MATRVEDIPHREPAHGGETHDIRCENCGLLLAKSLEYGSLEVRWKELWLRVWGRARIRCRKCGTLCDL